MGIINAVIDGLIPIFYVGMPFALVAMFYLTLREEGAKKENDRNEQV